MTASTRPIIRLAIGDNGSGHSPAAHHLSSSYLSVGGVPSSVAFSPDGTRLASGSADRTVRLWDPSTGAETLVLRDHEAEVMSVAFSPDGTRLVAASVDTVRLWDTVPESVRYLERAAVREAAVRAAPIVAGLFARDLEPREIVALIRADESLDDLVRHAALNEVLRRLHTAE